jgi:hypothetical protein
MITCSIKLYSMFVKFNLINLMFLTIECDLISSLKQLQG